MNTETTGERIHRGVLNFDEVLHGGLPTVELIVLASYAGSGKTTLSQQIIFSKCHT
jgi:KaiC/GvpD/RAD55 family RecA-like ATPase